MATDLEQLAGEIYAVIDEREDGAPWSGEARELSDRVRQVIEQSELSCIKCLGRDIYVRYHDARPHCAECKKNGDEPDSCKYDHCKRKKEHLRMLCRRCGYAWLTDTEDS